MAEVRRGQPSVTTPQLPQGAASQLNDALQPPARPIDIPVLYAGPNDQPPDVPDGATSENMQILTAPPNPAYANRVIPKERPGRVPRYVVRHLPRLMAAAKDPEAPASLKAVYSALVDQLSREMTEGLL